MGNIGDALKDTVGKMVTGVTTTVASGVILTFVTTYVLVDLKKDKDKEAAAADSAKTTMQVMSPETSARPGGSGAVRDGASGVMTPAVPEKSTAGGAPGAGVPTETVDAGTKDAKAIMPAGGTGAPAEPGEKPIEKKATEVRALADSTMKELDQAAQGREDKPEEAAKQKPTEIKPKQVELKKDVKDVRERADDVFDELDKEVEQTPVE